MRALVRPAVPLVVIAASAEELSLHESMLQAISRACKGRSLWQALEAAAVAGTQTLSSA